MAKKRKTIVGPGQGSVGKPSAEALARGPICDSCPVFCFRYITKNKHYNMNALRPGQAKELVKRLQVISGWTWVELAAGIRKDAGMETIPLHEITGFAIPEDKVTYESAKTGQEECVPITKVTVFRFGSGSNEGRIIGVKRPGCSIFHVLGVDPDFTAYNHG